LEYTVALYSDEYGFATRTHAVGCLYALVATVNPLIARLERTLASHSSDTLSHQFARAKLSAIVGDAAEARTLLQELLRQCNGRFLIDNFVFTNALQIALLTLQLDLVADLMNQRFQTERWFRVKLEENLPTPVQIISWYVNGRSSGLFSISDEIRTSSSFDVIVDRWVATLGIFAKYYHYGMVETGEVRINIGDEGEVPGLAFCGSRPECFLIPDPYYLGTRGYENIRLHFAQNNVAWDQRLRVAFWRGATTGDPSRGIEWRLLPRVRLCEIGRERRDLIDAGLSNIVQMPDAKAEEEICESGLMADFVRPEEFNKFRYQIDIDGNTNSWPGLFQKLLTGSPVLKVASPCDFRQWYYDRLKPWINFVPVAVDMSDLVEKCEWLKAHDDAARRIGECGQALAESLDYQRELNRASRTIGAAIRHFSGRPEAVLRFGAAEEGNVYLRGGWSEPAYGGVPATGCESRIELPRPITAGDLMLTLDVSPAGKAKILETQRLSVLLNGEILGRATLSSRDELHCLMPRRVIDQAETLAITLLHPDARISASAACPLDGRTVSIVLHGVSLAAARLHAARFSSELAPTGPEDEQSSASAAQMRVRSLSVGVHPKQILTGHGTVLFADLAMGQLRHGPPGSTTANVFLAADGQMARLLRWGPDGMWRSVSVHPVGSASQTSNTSHNGGDSAGTFSLVNTHGLVFGLARDGLFRGSVFGLARDGLFLCAEVDGSVTLSRRQMGQWEQFRLSEE
jgi:hypothetical protein